MIGQFEQSVLAAMMIVIMLGMGASLTPRDFELSLKRPFAMAIGLIGQYGFLPLIGFTLAMVLPLTPEQRVGLIIMSCMPGGTTSNLFTYFAKANLALSVLMTVNSTLFGVILIPLLLFLYASGVTADMPFGDIVRTLFVLLVPVLVGMLIRRWNANVGALIEILGAALGAIFIVLLLVTWVPRNWPLLLQTSWAAYAGVIGLGLLGFLSGYLFSQRLKLHPRNSRTIALEIGIQNGPLAIAVVLLSFDSAREQSVVLMPALYSLFIVINATVLTLLFRRADDAAEQKMPDALL